MSQVIYEVNVKIENSIFQAYLQWLQNHIREMLEIKGFLSATCYEEISDEFSANKGAQNTVCIHYILESKEALQHYFEQHAERMRADAVKNFGNKFSAWRRIMVKSRLNF